MAMMYRKQQSKYLTNYLSIFWEKLIFLKCILKSFPLYAMIRGKVLEKE